MTSGLMRYHVVGAHPNEESRTFDILVRAEDGRVLVVSIAPPRRDNWDHWSAQITAAHAATDGAVLLGCDAVVRYVGHVP